MRGQAADWDSRWMGLAREIGRWSKDRSRGVGCVIVGPNNEIRSTGFNGFPRGVNDEAAYRHERPAKYRWTEHAERNAVYNAARAGIPLDGCRMYVSWFPCMDCARAMIQTGISELICVEPDLTDAKWGADFAEVPQLLGEGGVSIRWWSESVSPDIADEVPATDLPAMGLPATSLPAIGPVRAVDAAD